MGNSSGVRDISLSEVLFVSFFRFFKSNLFGLCPISDQVTTPQNFRLRPLWFLDTRKPRMMSFHQRTWLRWLWGKQTWCKLCMLQFFPACMPTKMLTLVFARQLDISFNGNLKHFCCVRFWRLLLSYRSHATSADFARREDFPNPCFPRQTKRRQKDAKIPDICFFFPGNNANLSCYLLSVPWLIILFFGSAVAVLLPQCWAKHLLARS